MNRTAAVAVVAVSAPLGVVLATVAVVLAAWADYRRPRRRVPWDRY